MSISNKKNDEIWYKDIKVLFRYERLIEFFPVSEQTLEERINSIMRLSIYMSISLSLYHKKGKYMWLAIFMGIFTYIVHSRRPIKAEIKMQTKNPALFNNSYLASSNAVPEQNNSVGGIGESVNEEVTSSNCTGPTIDNPFMNVTMKDYMNLDENGTILDRQPACDSNDPDIKKQVDDYFKNNLYMDIDDVFGKMNSQRQFYTNPSTTIPNNQDEFAKWLYKTPETCKENSECLRYEDIRQNRPIYYDTMTNPINN
jgi:hypothetical protein